MKNKMYLKRFLSLLLAGTMVLNIPATVLAEEQDIIIEEDVQILSGEDPENVYEEEEAATVEIPNAEEPFLGEVEIIEEIPEAELFAEEDCKAEEAEYSTDENDDGKEAAAAYLQENYVTNNKIIINGGDGVVKSEDGLTYTVGLTIPSSGSSISTLRFKTEGRSSSYKSGWYLDADEAYVAAKAASSSGSRTIKKRDTKPYSFTATLKLFSSETETTAINDGTAESLASQDFTVILLPEAEKYSVSFQVVNKNTKEVVSDASVTLEKDWNTVSPGTDGIYTLSGDETYSLTVTADGYQKYTNASFQAFSSGVVPIELSPIVTWKVGFDVKDSSGNSVPGATVTVKKGYYGSVIPQEDGSYLLEEGTTYNYTVSATNYNTETGSINPTRNDTVSVTLTKNITSYQVSVCPVTAEGKAITNANVSVTYMEDDDVSYEDVETPLSPDTDGTYTMEKGTEYTIRVSADGYKTVSDTYTPSGDNESVTKQIIMQSDVPVDPADQKKVDALKTAFDKEYGALRPACGTDTNAAAFVLKKIQGYTGYDTDGVTVKLKTTENTSYVLEDGTIQYNKGTLGPYTNVVNVSCTFLFCCGNAQAETKARTVTIGWDRTYFNEKINGEAESLTAESIKNDNTDLDLTAVTSDFLLKQCMGTSLKKVWSVIDWTSSDTAVISLEDTGNGSKIDSKKAVVHPKEKDTDVTLTATFRANDSVLNTYVEAVKDFTEVKKTFTVTVKGTGTAKPTQEELLAILNKYYTTDLLKEFGTENAVNFENCLSDIQLPPYTRIKDEDGNYVFNNKEITVTSDHENVIKISGYRANVDIFQDAPVTVNLTVAFTREGITVSRQIPVKVGVITDAMLDAELVMMEQAKAHYFDGINDNQYADKDSITGNLHAFQEMTLDDNLNPVWKYNYSERTGTGIIPDSFFTDSWEMEAAGYNKFQSSNNTVVQHDNLLVNRQESDAVVTISSRLSSERYGKFAKSHPDNEKLQKLYKQEVSVTVTVKGTSVSPKEALELKVKELREELEQMVEGSGEGQYADGTKAALLTAIEDAEAVLRQEGATDSQFNSAVLALEEAEKQAENSRNVVSAEVTVVSVMDTTSGMPDYTVHKPVRADAAEKAGYTKPENLKNKVTVLDALVEFHREMFGSDDFDLAPSRYLNISESGWITTVFGTETTAVSFFVNNKMPKDVCNECVLNSGDKICVMLYGDTVGYSDKYLFLEQTDGKVTEGEAFKLIVKSAGYEVDETAAGCEVTVTGPDGTVQTETTGEDGTAAFMAGKAGSYTARITQTPFVYFATSGDFTFAAAAKEPEKEPEKEPAKEEAPVHQHSFGVYETVKEPTVFAEGLKERSCACGYKESLTVEKLSPTIAVNADKLPLKTHQSTTEFKVSGLAKGDYVKAWKSGNKKIFSVKGKADGTCRIKAGSKAGKAVLTITLASGLQKKVKVTVREKAVKTSKITGLTGELTIQKGKTAALKPVVRPITSRQKFTFSSSDKKVVSVNSRGVIKARKTGKAKIIVKSGSKTFTVKVVVEE